MKIFYFCTIIDVYVFIRQSIIIKAGLSMENEVKNKWLEILEYLKNGFDDRLNAAFKCIKVSVKLVMKHGFFH